MGHFTYSFTYNIGANLIWPIATCNWILHTGMVSCEDFD